MRSPLVLFDDKVLPSWSHPFLSSSQPVGHDDCALLLQLSVSIQGTASWRSRSTTGSLDKPVAPVSTGGRKGAPAHLPGSERATQAPQHHPLLHLLPRQAYVQHRHQSSIKNTDQDVLFAAQASLSVSSPSPTHPNK